VELIDAVKLERYPSTFGPTAIEKRSCLTEHRCGEVDFFAKREDCNAGLALGGSKSRKFEHIVPDAVACRYPGRDLQVQEYADIIAFPEIGQWRMTASDQRTDTFYYR
jgi:hypothetical protein